MDAHSEEERGDILGLQDTLLGQLVDVWDEGLLGRVGALVDVDPLLEPDE